MAYVGPGDIVTSAVGFGGLVKYNTAYSGNCCKVYSAADAANMTLGFLADGTVDTTNLVATLGAGPWTIHTLYDQLAVGDFIQTTEASRYTLVLTGSAPKAYMALSGSQYLARSSTPATALTQPYTIAGIAMDTATGGGVVLGGSDDGGGDAARFGFYSDDVNIFGASSAIDYLSGVSLNTWYAMQAVFYDISGVLRFNATEAIKNLGTTALAKRFTIGAQNFTGPSKLTGRVICAGVWPFGFDSTQRGNMATALADIIALAGGGGSAIPVFMNQYRQRRA